MPHATNPIITKDDFFTGATWNDPHVIKVNNEFIMYASANNINTYDDIKIYRLVSTNGTDWAMSPTTPVFTKSPTPSDWDSAHVETPAVVYFNSQYYMFYTGYDIADHNDPDLVKHFQVGYATSPDGITWTRQPIHLGGTDPFNSTPNLDFNQWVVAEPAPVVFNGRLYVYFTALGADISVGTTLQTIGVTSTADGATWEVPQLALRPDQTLYPRGSGYIGYSTPHAAVLDGKVNLFFDVAIESPFQQVKLHRAVSADGLTGWSHDSEAIFDRSEFSPWASVDLRSPAVLLEGRTLYFWFAGHGDLTGFPSFPSGHWGIGLAKCEL